MTCLAQSSWASDTVLEVYKNDTGVVVRIDKFDARNNDTAPRRITVHIVESGSTVDNSNKRLTADIQPSETLDLLEIVGHDLNIGDAIHVFADVTDVVSFRISGRLV